MEEVEEGEMKQEAEYHSHDFEWEQLRGDVEANPSFSYHLSLLAASTTTPPTAPSEAWSSFHRRHASGRFFKERRYLLKEFPELLDSKDSAKILEVGCGNGSTVLPILRAVRNSIIYACDCSKATIENMKEILSNTRGVNVEDRLHPFLLDISKENFPDSLFCGSCQSSFGKAAGSLLDSSHQKMRNKHHVLLGENECCVGGIDLLTMIFTLSAIPFNRMSTVIERCASVLKPGGLLLFRDYGLYDMTMLRFLPHQRVGFREYMRSDGTLSYFFSLDIVKDLFYAAGLRQLELEYCCVRSINRKNGKKMHRVWVHGKFQKSMC